MDREERASRASIARARAAIEDGCACCASNRTVVLVHEAAEMLAAYAAVLVVVDRNRRNQRYHFQRYLHLRDVLARVAPHTRLFRLMGTDALATRLEAVASPADLLAAALPTSYNSTPSPTRLPAPETRPGSHHISSRSLA